VAVASRPVMEQRGPMRRSGGRCEYPVMLESHDQGNSADQRQFRHKGDRRQGVGTSASLSGSGWPLAFPSGPKQHVVRQSWARVYFSL